MNPSKKNRLYSKYLAGDISREEMHELNQYALDDDFLFDAIEGTSAFEKSNAASIKDLNSRIDAKSKNKRRPLVLWFSAAAAVAILIVAVNFLNPLQNELSQQVAMQEEPIPSEIAMDKEEMLAETADSGIASPAEESDDSRKSIPQEEVAATPAKKYQNNKVKAAEPASVSRPSSPKPAEEPVVVSSLPNKIEQDLVLVDDVKEESVSAGLSLLKETNNDVAGKVNQDNVVEREIRSEQETESAPPISIVAREESEQKKDANSTRTNSKNDAEPINAFIPSRSAASPKRKKSSTEELSSSLVLQESYIPKITIEGDQVNSDLFQKHINAQIPTYTSAGEFLASFNITDKGRISNFKVLKSADAVLDEKLKALIESFKGWQGLGNKEVKILFN
jgi:hypothetical protein